MKSQFKSISQFFTLIILFALFSCSENNKIKLVEPKHTFNRYGRVENKPIQTDKKKVITYLVVGMVNIIFADTPKGKVDSIIRANPDWQFIYYIDCQEKDSLYIMKKLNQYDCDFEVVLDFNREFEQKNFPDSHMGGIGYICDEANEVYGVSIIGSSKSFFDSEFAKAKEILR